VICGATRSLQEQIASGQVEISELRGKMTVKLKDKVLFAPASAGLNKEGKTALDAVASAFRELKGKNVVVAGYTDDVPLGSNSGFPDNWALSTARAVDVVRYLQSKGVSQAMLGAAGFSEYRPVVPNNSAANRSQNRRIEIALTAAEGRRSWRLRRSRSPARLDSGTRRGEVASGPRVFPGS